MLKKLLFRDLIVLSLIALTGFSSVVSARPLQVPSVFVQQDELKKLPPVNWIRSRTIDVKDISIDLRFDWEKEQAYGSTVITLAPFNETDTIFRLMRPR